MKNKPEFLNLVPYNSNKAEFDKRNDHYKATRKAEGFHAIWSIYEVADLHSQALHGEFQVYFLGRFNHADDKKEVRKIAVSNPTWLDLWRVANELICEREAEYRTDLYVEGFEPDTDGDLEIQYGS
ncbi:hypothetical protein [Burkholderia cenocepacia]|uniref:hypothetical protein n=1 Tax=Burkholderia cenocepacia TaxID=95486 RepID=UPI001178A728|nr:hypothetical protein [Burkholderia cenocepacia]